MLALDRDVISALTLFVEPVGPRLFHAFELPLILPDTASAELLFAPAVGPGLLARAAPM